MNVVTVSMSRCRLVEEGKKPSRRRSLAGVGRHGRRSWRFFLSGGFRDGKWAQVGLFVWMRRVDFGFEMEREESLVLDRFGV